MRIAKYIVWYEDDSSGMLRRVVWKKFPDFSEELAAPIIKAVSTHRPDDGERASTSETSVNFYQTIRRNIPEKSPSNLNSYVTLW
jgi:hypothetical protein